MKTLKIIKSSVANLLIAKLILKACKTIFLLSFILNISTTYAQTVLFDFDNAPFHSPLPITLTSGGITAYFSATGDGYSIQEANVHGFTPQGFAGYILDPSSIYLADLLICFDRTLTDFSIMYACNELGCDDAATMRVTAYKQKTYIGTNTKTTAHPGTWPSDTLACSFQQGFDSVVVHYDSPPPTCKDYGVVFMADNMRVIASSSTGVTDQRLSVQGLIIPNPFTQCTAICFYLLQPGNINITIYDITGKIVKNLIDGPLNEGEHKITWNINDEAVKSGLYFLKMTGKEFSSSFKLIVLK